MSQHNQENPGEFVSLDSIECQLALRKALDDILDELIIAAAKKVVLLENNRNVRTKKLALSRSQVRNVVNEASQTRSSEAVTNFIRYQMGRKGGEAWRDEPYKNKVFGNELISDIDTGIEAHVDKVFKYVKRDLSEKGRITDFVDLKREVRARAIRLYLAYFNRTYAYCESMDKQYRQCWRDIESIAERKVANHNV
jgi:hypothetical protein